MENPFSNVIGFTNVDDKGQEGIELAKNDILKSITGVKKLEKITWVVIFNY